MIPSFLQADLPLLVSLAPEGDVALDKTDADTKKVLHPPGATVDSPIMA
jgi:hypothetical protein